MAAAGDGYAWEVIVEIEGSMHTGGGEVMLAHMREM